MTRDICFAPAVDPHSSFRMGPLLRSREGEDPPVDPRHLLLRLLFDPLFDSDRTPLFGCGTKNGALASEDSLARIRMKFEPQSRTLADCLPSREPLYWGLSDSFPHSTAGCPV